MQIYGDYDNDDDDVHLQMVILGNNANIVWCWMFTVDDVDFISSAAVTPKVYPVPLGATPETFSRPVN